MRRAPATGVILAFLVVSYLALWNATLRFGLPLPFTLANKLLAPWKNYAEMIFLYFIAFNIARDEKEQKTVVTIMATVFMLIVMREFRSFTADQGFSYDHRATGPFWADGLGANHFGAFIADYGSLFLGLYLLDKHKYRKWIYLAGFGFCIYPLFYSYSRGAYAAMLAAIVTLGCLRKPSLLIPVALVVVLWQTVLPSSVVDRISMTEISAGGSEELEASAAHRIILWEEAERNFREHTVFGIGFNAFGFTVPKGELTDTHNFFMKTAAEQGVIGLLILAAVLIRMLASGWSLYRRGPSSFHRGLGLGFLGCLAAVVVSNVFGDRWSYFMLGSYLWIFWGLIDRARQLQQMEPATEPLIGPSSAPARIRGLLAANRPPLARGQAGRSLLSDETRHGLS